MKFPTTMVLLVSAIMLASGCSSEKLPEPANTIPAIVLSAADKDKLRGFQKEILNIETVADKTLALAGEELKNVLKGGETSLNLPAIIAKARTECMRAGESLASKAIPEALPPEAKKLLSEGKAGLIAAYTAYAGSLGAVGSFVTDKNPVALLEYRKKNAEAQQLLKEATQKLTTIMAAAGVKE